MATHFLVFYKEIKECLPSNEQNLLDWFIVLKNLDSGGKKFIFIAIFDLYTLKIFIFIDFK